MKESGFKARRRGMACGRAYRGIAISASGRTASRMGMGFIYGKMGTGTRANSRT
jgi:hypothetical protein